MFLIDALFGPSRAEVWSRLAAEMEGRYDSGSWLQGSKVEVDAGPWTITLDTYHVNKHTYTRLRAPYVNPAGFRFHVFREGFFAEIGKAFGMQDVDVGVREFDDAWVVQGTDAARLVQLFRTDAIRQLLGAAGQVSFQVRDDEGWFGRRFPEGVDELILTTHGVVRDLPRLKVFFALFAETLDRLVEIRAADRRDPGV